MRRSRLAVKIPRSEDRPPRHDGVARGKPGYYRPKEKQQFIIMLKQEGTAYLSAAA